MNTPFSQIFQLHFIQTLQNWFNLIWVSCKIYQSFANFEKSRNPILQKTPYFNTT